MNLEFIQKDIGSVATLDNFKIFKAEDDTQGFYYKDYEAFKNGDGVCYISEYGFDTKDDMFYQHDRMNTLGQDVCIVLDTNKPITEPFNTRESIIQDCKEALKNNGIKFSKKQLEDLAYDVFCNLDWQSPYTLANEFVEGLEA